MTEACAEAENTCGGDEAMRAASPMSLNAERNLNGEGAV